MVSTFSSEQPVCALDYDDTIMQTRQCKMQAVIALADRLFGQTLTETEIEPHWGISHYELFQNLFEIDGDRLEETLQAYEEIDEEFPLVPHEDSLRGLVSLKKHFRLAIVSSCTRSLIETQLENSDLSEIDFDKIFGAEDTEHHKPSGEVFKPLFANYPDLSKDNYVYIGDGIKDMQAANAAGLTFIGIDRFEGETAKLHENGARVASSLVEISRQLASDSRFSR